MKNTDFWITIDKDEAGQGYIDARTIYAVIPCAKDSGKSIIYFHCGNSSDDYVAVVTGEASELRKLIDDALTKGEMAEVPNI